MKNENALLVLAGTREALEIAEALIAAGRPVVVSLPEPDRGFDALPVCPRIGRFAGPDDLRSYLTQNRITRVIDAGHAFESGQSDLAAAVCATMGLPCARVLRPAWVEEAGDRWLVVQDLTHAVRMVSHGARVFSNTGRATQETYAEFPGERLYLRQTVPHGEKPPYPFMRYFFGTPPFSTSDEETLFSALEIDQLICRNVGGKASRSKIHAARSLGIQVIMIAPPDPPRGVPVFETSIAALAWACAA